MYRHPEYIVLILSFWLCFRKSQHNYFTQVIVPHEHKLFFLLLFSTGELLT